eukprot:SAG22_NODE_4822_length_1157_cov_1.172968_2_plen_108_part_00
MTFVRKAAFRSAEHMTAYFADCHAVIEEWRAKGPQLLEPAAVPADKVLGEELSQPHGLYLFKTRNEPVEYFPPNFHPKIIADVLAKQWHSPTLSWQDAPPPPPALVL